VSTPPAHAGREVLLYVNQVYEDDPAGQGAFERDIIGALLRRADAHPGTVLHVLTVARLDADATRSRDPRVEALPLDKRSYGSYVVHQLRLAVRLAALLWRHRGDRVSIYARHNMAMVAPVILALLFHRPLTLRTGPLRRHEEAGRRYGWLTYVIAWSLLWVHLRVARALIVVSSVARDWAHHDFPFTRGRVVILPNAVDPERVRLEPRDRARWGVDDGRVVVGWAGTATEGNGLQTVIRALHLLRERGEALPQLLIVGDGPCLPEWQRLAGALVESRDVVFAGRRSPQDIPAALAACDVALAPFTAAEIARAGSSALKLFEALACDRPLLAVRCLDHAFIEDEQVGWLVTADDADAWARALGALDPRTIALEGRGRALVERRFSFDSLAERLWGVATRGPGAEAATA
jgi:glycosyltransferase involved in cell wall biosynthesis